MSIYRCKCLNCMRANANHGKWVRLREAEELERQLNNLARPNATLEGRTIEQWRTAALEAESEARSEMFTRKVYQRVAKRRFDTIKELRATAKINEDFIDLLQQRLAARLSQLDRVRQACDGGKGLDP